MVVSSCGFESEDRKIGRLEAEIKALQTKNSELHIKNAENNINEIGGASVVIIVSATIILFNNIVWLIAYRRKK